MPIKTNAKKALRQAEKRAKRNKLVRDGVKKTEKLAAKALEAGEGVVEAVRDAQQRIAKAAKKGLIKPNTAARKIGRLMKKAHKATVGSKKK